MTLMVYFLICFYFSFMADLKQVMAFMEQTSNGNLQHTVVIDGHDELSGMTSVMYKMVSNLSSMVASVRSNSALVSYAGSSLVNGNRALSERTEQQAASLEQISASVQELSILVGATASAASTADVAARSVRDQAEGGLKEMASAVKSVEAIQNSTKRMDEVIGVIDGLAFQTKILALNAAVEAARAGESGRGFAVVASEVRSLAQRSSASAKEIRALIAHSSAQVDSGVIAIRNVGDRIEKVVGGIRELSISFSSISSSSNEQSTSLIEITAAVRQLEDITQKNLYMVENYVDQSSALQEQADRLGKAVSDFQLQQGTADEAKATVDKAQTARNTSSSTEDFIRKINGIKSEYYDRDMYLFVLDNSGRYVGFA
jgi:methyl-accepting chemotaxis protein